MPKLTFLILPYPTTTPTSPSQCPSLLPSPPQPFPPASCPGQPLLPLPSPLPLLSLSSPFSLPLSPSPSPSLFPTRQPLPCPHHRSAPSLARPSFPSSLSPLFPFLPLPCSPSSLPTWPLVAASCYPSLPPARPPRPTTLFQLSCYPSPTLLSPCWSPAAAAATSPR